MTSYLTPGDLLEALIGQQIPGGCDTCDAVQVVAKLASHVFAVQVNHDDDCPELAQHRARQAQ